MVLVVVGVGVLGVLAYLAYNSFLRPTSDGKGTGQREKVTEKKADDSKLIERNYKALHSKIVRMKTSDAVITIEGERIQGEIVKDDITGMVIARRHASEITIPRTGIRSVELSANTGEEFIRRLESAEAGDGVNDLEALLEWARSRELTYHLKLVAWAILKRDRDHRKARQALGFKRAGTRWVKG